MVTITIRWKLVQILICMNQWCLMRLSSIPLKIFSSRVYLTLKKTAIALTHAGVTFKEIRVDSSLSPEEIEELLSFNLSEKLDSDSGKINFDYQVIERGSTNSSTLLQVVAVPEDQVKRWCQLLRAAKLSPKIVDIDLYAIERAIRHQLKNIEELVAVVIVDHGTVFIVVIDQKKVIYYHEEFVGSESLGSIAQVVAQIDLQLRMIAEVLSHPVKQLVLAGEKSLLIGLDQAINAQLNVKTTMADPFSGMQLSSMVKPELIKRIAPMMLISCGLALRVADEYET